jgi:hypothetical protein
MTDVKPPAPAPPSAAPDPAPTREEDRAVSDRKVFESVVQKYADKQGGSPPGAPSQQPTPPTPETSSAGEAPAKPAPKNDEGGGPEPAPPPTKIETKGPAGADVKKAKEFLRLKAKARDSAMDSMDPEDLVAWAADVRERESTVDRSLRERADALRELDELKAKAEPVAGEGEPKPEPAPNPDRKAAVSTLADELALGDEGRKALEKFAETLTAPLETGLAETRETVRAERVREAFSVTERTRAELGKRFPELAEDETWKKVFATARKSEDEPEFGGKEGAEFAEYLPRLLESSLRFHGIKEIDPKAEAEAAKAAKEERDQRVADGPTVDSRPTAPAPQSKEAADWAVFQRGVKKYRQGSAVG